MRQWTAGICVNNLRRNIATVDTEIEAAKSRGVERRRFLDDHAEDRVQLDRVEQTIEARVSIRLGQIGRNPPACLTSVLGPIPESRTNRTAWWSGARHIETYRARFDITDQTTALGPGLHETARSRMVRAQQGPEISCRPSRPQAAVAAPTTRT